MKVSVSHPKGRHVLVVNGYYLGKKGVIKKTPQPDDLINIAHKWKEAFGESDETPLIDMYHVQLDSGPLITFFQTNDLVLVTDKN